MKAYDGGGRSFRTAPLSFGKCDAPRHRAADGRRGSGRHGESVRRSPPADVRARFLVFLRQPAPRFRVAGGGRSGRGDGAGVRGDLRGDLEPRPVAGPAGRRCPRRPLRRQPQEHARPLRVPAGAGRAASVHPRPAGPPDARQRRARQPLPARGQRPRPRHRHLRDRPERPGPGSIQLQPARQLRRRRIPVPAIFPAGGRRTDRALLRHRHHAGGARLLHLAAGDAGRPRDRRDGGQAQPGVVRPRQPRCLRAGDGGRRERRDLPVVGAGVAVPHGRAAHARAAGATAGDPPVLPQADHAAARCSPRCRPS